MKKFEQRPIVIESTVPIDKADVEKLIKCLEEKGFKVSLCDKETAIRKQTPRSVVNQKTQWFGIGLPFPHKAGWCPECDRLVIDVSYCQHCGQALDWN